MRWPAILTPRRARRQRRIDAGTHHPRIIDASRKLCMECHTW